MNSLMSGLPGVRFRWSQRRDHAWSENRDVRRKIRAGARRSLRQSRSAERPAMPKITVPVMFNTPEADLEIRPRFQRLLH